MNLKHLHYFWTVARTGSVARAAERLHLTPQTISAQIKLLEDSLGVELFKPAGRGLELTEAGRVALSYANEIEDLSGQLKAALIAHRGRPAHTLHVGISDVVPKSFAYRLLAPIGRAPEPMRLICREGPLDLLLGELALHRLEMVVADRPMPVGLNVRAHSHKLGESPIAFFGTSEIAAPCRGFPECLDDAPMLLPGQGSAIRAEIDRWLGETRISPRVMGEFDDGALMKAFGQAGGGFFPAPAALADEIVGRYGVEEAGRVESVREAFWLISTERRITHPAVLAVIEAAHGAFVAPSQHGVAGKKQMLRRKGDKGDKGVRGDNPE
jgi:LysR family transcriptional activator of nhaA